MGEDRLELNPSKAELLFIHQDSFCLMSLDEKELPQKSSSTTWSPPELVTLAGLSVVALPG